MTSLQKFPDNFILEGFMGCGKTSVGKELAEMTGYTFIDTDTEVQRLAGESIHDMLKRGELARVRAWEQQACEILASGTHTVIATGGGVFTNPVIAERFHRSGMVICLERPFDEIYPLISEDPIRVMAYHKSYDELLALSESRIPAYHRYADLILDNTGSPREAAEKILDFCRH